jgi:F0F1-type ATP synthase membrane subunit b/b'
MRQALLSFIVLALPGLALAATEGEHHGPSFRHLINDVGFQGAMLNSLLLFAILYWAFGGKIAKALEERKASVQSQLEEAKRLREQAEARHREYETRLAQLDAELASLRASIVHSGEAERDRLVKEAESKAARMREDASRLIENRLAQLEKDLHREVVVAAVGAAQKELERMTTAEDQTRLAADYLKIVESAGSALGKETLS